MLLSCEIINALTIVNSCMCSSMLVSIVAADADTFYAAINKFNVMLMITHIW